MAKALTNKKITRGISKNFADLFKTSELFKLYQNHKDELFIGVRNDYLNLYYNCDSIARIEHKKRTKEIVCVIDRYYLDGKSYKSDDKAKHCRTTPMYICDHYEKIKKNSFEKATFEKQAQSKLVILNNDNKKSNWFCIDVEYIKQFNNKEEKRLADFNGRFDIIALSKAKPHRVALIELKYGGGAMGGKSGIYKHVEDFKKFSDKDYFEGHLKQEIIEIVRSQIDLGIDVPFQLPEKTDLLAPEFFFITLDNNAEKAKASSPQQTMAGYLFKTSTWECNRLSKKGSVEKMFGDITKKSNKLFATFLFSTDTLGNIGITDIIDGGYDGRIEPK